MNEQEKNVVEYLTEHPDFFTTHPDLLAKLSVVHPQKGTLSLVEAQLEQQRQQIKTLTAFLEKFHQLVYQEADIFYALMPLQKKLFQAEDFQRGEEKLKQWAQSYELDGAKTSHKPTALLLFTSRDTARFHNGQDTTFLKHIVDIVELHLGRWV